MVYSASYRSIPGQAGCLALSGGRFKAIRSATHESASFASRRRIVHGQIEGPDRRAQPDRAPVRQGLDHAARQERQVDGRRNDFHGLARPRYRARRRRPAARPGGGDLRAGILRQNDAGAAHHRRSPEARRHLRLRRRRARARSGLCAQARRQCRRPLDLAAGRRRAGAGNRRHAGALRRHRRAGGRFGGGARAALRARRRDGRRAAGLAGAPDEPGAAQADRLDFEIAHHGDVHQPDPHEDRRDVRLAGDDLAAAMR